MSDHFGAARPATVAEVHSHFAGANQPGLHLAHFYDHETDKSGDALIYGGERHFLLFGPNGSGKGTRLLLPNLLGTSLRGRSIVAIDPKGELAAVSAMHQHKIGQKVKILDPFGVVAKLVKEQPETYRYLTEQGLVESVGFNPLDSLDPTSTTFYDDAAGIGEALIRIEGSDPHWSESAQGLVIALIMWEKQLSGAKASLENVRLMLTEPDEFEETVGEDGKVTRRQVGGLRAIATEMMAGGGFAVRSLARRFMVANDEIASIQSSADTQTRWLLSDPVRADLGKSGMDFTRLKEEATTVYVVLPAERLRTHSVWLRLVIVTALRSLYRAGGLRTLLFIDELAALGHLGPIEDAFGLVRGYRVQIAAILQDLNQLKTLYKDRWETFIANAGVVMGFAPNDLTTADWMSKRAGMQTITVHNRTDSTNLSAASQSSGESKSANQAGRALYLPQDLIGFEEGMGLIWLAGMGNPVTFFAPPYYKMRDRRERALPNPYYRPDE